MEWKARMWPTFAAEVLAARASLRLGDEVGLAVRAERQRLGLSQRAYAARRGWTLATVIRLETAADGMKLGDVADALDGTPFQLCLCHRPPGHEPGNAAQAAPEPPHAPPPVDQPTSAPGSSARPGLTPVPQPPATPGPPTTPGSPSAPEPPQPVHPSFWPRAELVARVRGGRRRFPAHHVTEQVDVAPPWWWYAESSRAGTVAPNWYAPQYTQRRPTAS